MPDLCVPLTSPGTRSLPAMTARPIPPICDALAVGLCFSEQRFEAGLQVLSDGVVETVINLAGLDQVLPLAAREREAGDGQRLPLRRGFLDPIVRAADRIIAVSQLGDDTLKAGLAGMFVRLLAIDLEALAELYAGVGDQLLKERLALTQ